MEINFNEYASHHYSQFGQDGIIEKVFSVIGTTDKFFVEFGSSGDDEGGGNTAYLRKQYGFDGLLIDASDDPFRIQSKKQYDRKIHAITAENIDDILRAYGVPKTFDFLSIDIDGNDYWVWKAIRHTPRVVCIEINYSIPLDWYVVQKYDPKYVWDCSFCCGSACLPMVDLAQQKGYSLVAANGSDLIFVKNSEIPSDVSIYGINSVEKLCLCTMSACDEKTVTTIKSQLNRKNWWVDPKNPDVCLPPMYGDQYVDPLDRK